MSAFFVWLAVATLVSEDLTCLAAGAAVAAGVIPFGPASLACATGIFGGDLLLYFAGRWARRLLPDSWLRNDAPSWLAQRTWVAVIGSRFMPGMRLPVYVASGALRVSLLRFALCLALAALLWTPLLVGIAAVAGQQAARSALHAVLVLSATVATWFGFRRLSDWKTRRRMIGLWGRISRWEFWPAWLAYVPVVLYILRLAVRYRSLTLFTAANPGIPGGGVTGESKSRILAEISGAGVVPARLVQPGELIDRFPVVLKPDVGERGRGVAIVRSAEDAARYLDSAQGDVILQPRVGQVEFGVFYCRFPDQQCGRILSITEKRLPVVTGDGNRTLEELILADPRAVCLAPVYLRNVDGSHIPAVGERVQLSELGSHCRGAVFLDGRQHLTMAVFQQIEAISRRFDGFYFGRYDIRAESIEAFERGDFHVIELNGVTGEPAHIYDPAVSLPDAYRALFQHWRIAFALGAANRTRGAEPWSVRQLLSAAMSSRGLPACPRRARRYTACAQSACSSASAGHGQ